MAHTDEQLSLIFNRTDGHCHLCGLKLGFGNYGRFGRRGAWEVEHSNPRCNGGSSRLCNLYAAHIACNRQKGAVTTRTARAWNGRTKAPPSRQKKNEMHNDNRWGWGSIGALTGGAILGPPGLLLGGILGAIVGDRLNPE